MKKLSLTLSIVLEIFENLKRDIIADFKISKKKDSLKYDYNILFPEKGVIKLYNRYNYLYFYESRNKFNLIYVGCKSSVDFELSDPDFYNKILKFLLK